MTSESSNLLCEPCTVHRSPCCTPLLLPPMSGQGVDASKSLEAAIAAGIFPESSAKCGASKTNGTTASYRYDCDCNTLAPSITLPVAIAAHGG